MTTDQFNAGDLLDAKLSDLADLPEWKNWPNGVYVAKPSVKIEKKPNKETKQDDTIITVAAKLISVKELEQEGAEPPQVGAETNVRYTWNNEFGQGALKNLLAGVAMAAAGGDAEKAKELSVKALLDLIHTADSLTFVVSNRADKNKKDVFYQQFKELTVE